MISERLAKIASMIDKDMVVADIGTDHAFLPIYLVKEGICRQAYALDNKQGPLKQATRNIAAYGLKDSIETLLSDGLEAVPPKVDAIVIAGMGVDTMIEILDRAKNRLKDFRLLVLQPNNNVHLLREWIAQQGFAIVREHLVKEYKTYQILAVDPHQSAHYDRAEIYLGPLLMQEKSDIFVKYHHDRYQRLKGLHQKYPQKEITEEYRILKEFFESREFR